jgi:hypothetical protein
MLFLETWSSDSSSRCDATAQNFLPVITLIEPAARGLSNLTRAYLTAKLSAGPDRQDKPHARTR